MRGIRLLCSSALVAALLALPSPAGALDVPECVGPAGDPQPDTPEWQEREAVNAYCGEQRAYDTAANPLFAAGWAEMQERHPGEDFRADPFRDPLVLAGSRFRYQQVSVPGPSGGL